MPGPYSVDNLLITKLEIPLVGHRIVSRNRLTDLLKAGIEKQLTLIVAPAGYGKTTLLVELVSSMIAPDWRVIWLTVDALDNKPMRLWAYIARALKKIYPRIQFAPQELFQDEQEKPSLERLTPLFNAIAQTPYKLILVLDDYQWITNEQTHEEIQYLLTHQPKNLHLLISSRIALPFPLSRLRTQRQVFELNAMDLSFNLQEIQTYFSLTAQKDINDDQALSLFGVTEGWIAGLQLLILSMAEHPDKKAFISNLPEENFQIFEYLTEEVLDHQSPELRNFLLKTSILPEFSAPLCNAVLERNDSLEMLKQAQQANLFIFSLDSNHYWYSYHNLFADTLQKYLQDTTPEIIPELHRRAVHWLHKNGYPDKAVAHALSYGDVERAAKIIEDSALQAIVKFDLLQLTQWIGQFSNELIKNHPQLGIYYALANFLLEKFDKVEPRLLSIEQALAEQTANILTPSEEKYIRWEIGVLRACLGYWKKHSSKALHDLEAQMKTAPENDVYFYGLMLHNLATVQASLGDLEASESAYLRGCQFAIEHRLEREYCYSMSELAHIWKMQGWLDAACQGYQDMIDYALRFQISDDVIAHAKSGLAEIALERNQIDQASEMVEWIIEHSSQIEMSPLNYIRQEWIFVRLSRYYLAIQDMPNALRFYDKAMKGHAANRQVVHFLSAQLIDLQVKMWRATGWADINPQEIENQIIFLDTLNKSQHASQIATAHYYLHKGKYTKTLEILNKLRPQLETFGMNERLMEVRMLEALAYQASEQKHQAADALYHALELASPEGYRNIFTNEGKPMKHLLEYCLQQQPDEVEYSKEHINTLINSLLSEMEKTPLPDPPPAPHVSITPIQSLPEPLSKRELEVLKLLGDGKSTKETALALHISINTIKFHIKNIYRKTSTHTRTALIQIAKKHGLLSPPEEQQSKKS